MAKQTRSTIASYIGSLLGALLFVIGINIITVPHQLYSGTLTGVAQVIESVLTNFTAIEISQNLNITGTVLLLLNIPLMIMVLQVTSRTLPAKSIATIVFMTTAMSFVPIPAEPVIYDPLTASIVGGAIAGFGTGFTLRCGGTTGGSDLIGIYCSVKYPNFTVGRVVLLISVIVYGYGLIFYDLNIVIYSALFTTIYAVALDHTHHQNIKVSAIIFTKSPEAVKDVMEKLDRGATCWEGCGAYTGQHTHIFTTVISKYEVPRLKRVVHESDPSAFIIINSKVDVSGNFIKKF